jgi:hypothetical protein
VYEISNMRVFHFERINDVSGVSGTGRVAEGVEFSDGTCVVRWLTVTSSTCVYDNFKQMESIHGHGGSTKIVFDQLVEEA